MLRVLSILLRGFYFNEFPESHLKIKKWERMRRNESSGLTQVRLSGTVTVKTLTFQETNLGLSFCQFQRSFGKIFGKYLASDESTRSFKVNGLRTEIKPIASLFARLTLKIKNCALYQWRNLIFLSKPFTAFASLDIIVYFLGPFMSNKLWVIINDTSGSLQ